MITRKMITSIKDLQEIQRLASHCPDDVALHSEDGTVMIDAKSYIGMYTLDFSKPVLVVSENKEFHQAIKPYGTTVE